MPDNDGKWIGKMLQQSKHSFGLSTRFFFNQCHARRDPILLSPKQEKKSIDGMWKGRKEKSCGHANCQGWFITRFYAILQVLDGPYVHPLARVDVKHTLQGLATHDWQR